MIKDLFDILKSKFNSASEEPQQKEETTSAFNHLTTDKIKAIVADLTDANSIFEEAGFEMLQLEIEVGLMPKIVPQFKQFKFISSEDEGKLLNQLNERKLLKFVLQSLFKSSRMSALMENTSMDLAAIEISVSAPPSVKTIFKKNLQTDSTLDITHH